MRGEHLHLLLIDEDPADLTSVGEILSRADQLTLARATCLASGLKLIDANSFDAVLLGLPLSNASSLSTISRIVQALPAMPIVIMVNSADEDLLLEAAQHGIQDYLLKERVDRLSILIAARSAIERKRAENAARQARGELEFRVQERTIELQRTNQALRMLSACNEAVIRMDDEQTLMQEICRIAVDIGGYRMAWVGMAEDDAAKSVRPVAYTGFEDGYLGSARISWADNERGQGPTGMAIRTGKVRIGTDFLTDPRLAPWREEAIRRGFRCSIALPLRQGEAVVGALTVYRSEAAPFDEDQVKILHELAVDLAFGLTALRMRTLLRESRDRLRALAGELTLTEQRERRRLARVLHDHLQQLLVGAKFRTAILGRSEDECIKQAAAEIEGLLNESIAASRSLTAELSPPILHEGGLAVGLEWLSRWMTDKHGLCIELNVEQEVSPTAEDVKVLVFESIRELLFNVVKHARTKSATVTMRRENGAWMRIEVSDHGAGFDPSLTVPTASGGGFGLFSIRERLDLIGGELKVRSSPGQGSRFTITAPLGKVCPLADGDQTLVAPPRPAMKGGLLEEVASPGRGAKIRVLLADDHAVMRQGLVRLLEEEPDIEIVGEACDGQMAVDLALRLGPDVILMDIGMPRLNGLEATRKISRELPASRVIGLSMFEESEQAQAMFQAGAVAYLSKSGPAATLIATIRSSMDDQSRRGE